MSKKYSKLPKYKAPARVWESLENELDQKAILSKAIQNMPVHKAPDPLWKAIDNTLRPNRRILPIFVRVAAVLILVTGLLWLLSDKVNLDDDQVAHAVEKSDIIKVVPSNEPEKNDTLLNKKVPHKKEINVAKSTKKASSPQKTEAKKDNEIRKDRNSKGLNILPMQGMRGILSSNMEKPDVLPVGAAVEVKRKPQIKKVKISVANKPIAENTSENERRFRFSMFNNWRRIEENYQDTSEYLHEPLLVARINL
jgi:hypothetical protein